MKTIHFVLLTGLIFGGTACARLYGNVYEGVQMQKRHEVTANDDGWQPNEATPSYEEYQRQRRLATETPAGSSTQGQEVVLP